eukprot:1451743-Rhodomonas_salina.2
MVRASEMLARCSSRALPHVSTITCSTSLTTCCLPPHRPGPLLSPALSASSCPHPSLALAAPP